MLKTKPNEIANQPQTPHETSAAVRVPRRGLWQEWLRSLLLFCGAREDCQAHCKKSMKKIFMADS